MATQEARNSHAWMAALLAGMFGAGMALLFAPRSGKETRDKISDQADDMKRQARESMISVRESLNRSLRDAQELKDRISTALKESTKESMEERPDRGREQAPTAQSSVLSTWEEEV